MSNSSPRRALELGLLRLYNELDICPLDPSNLLVDPTSRETLQASADRFCLAHGIPLDRIREAAKKVKRIGYLKKIDKRQLIVSSTITWTLFRSVKVNWDAIDGTICVTSLEQQTRYQIGVQNRSNSCAIDVVLLAAIQLDIGRRQVDQMDIHSLARLRPTAFLLREVVKMAWGQTTDTARTSIRDFLCSKLFDADRKMFPKRGFRSALDVAIYTLQDTPQLTFTKLRAWTCCDDFLQLDESRVPEIQSYLAITLERNALLIDAIRHIFRVRKTVLSPRSCTRGQACTQTLKYGYVIIDRPPPILTIFCYYRKPDFQTRFKLPIVLQLAIPVHGLTEELEYRLTGCVFFCNGNHYILRWMGRTDGRILSFDGLKNGGHPTFVTTWEESLGRESMPHMVFYQIQYK